MAGVHEALAAVMADVEGVAKRDRNDHGGFRFRGIDAILNAVGPALRRHSLMVLPRLDDITETTVEVGRNRTRMGHVTVLVTYVFVAVDGSTVECRVPGEAMDSGDKAASKAMSVALRTALIQALALPTDEPDPDERSYERSDAAPPPMTATQQTSIADILSGLAEDATAEVKAWWKAEGLPHMDRLTEDQAGAVLDHLDHIEDRAAAEGAA